MVAGTTTVVAVPTETSWCALQITCSATPRRIGSSQGCRSDRDCEKLEFTKCPLRVFNGSLVKSHAAATETGISDISHRPLPHNR